MRTDWIVTKVTATPNLTVADLQQVEWWKKNPVFDTDDEAVDEFLDAEPGEHGAEYSDLSGRLSLEITDGLDLNPGDPISMTLAVVERVPA